jgi:hypothetical protein
MLLNKKIVFLTGRGLAMVHAVAKDIFPRRYDALVPIGRGPRATEEPQPRPFSLQRAAGMKRFSVLLAACGLAALAQQRAPAPSFVAEAKQNYAAVKDNLLKSADKMPEEGYSFQPTPDVRPFGAMVAHVTETQFWVCGTLMGSTNKPPGPGKTKAELVAALKASFDTCDSAYDSVTAANQSQIAGTGFLKRSRLAVLFLNNEHDSETYGTMSVYLRLKGIVPPSSEGSK